MADADTDTVADKPSKSKNCDTCKGAGGFSDCGWWYECRACYPEAYEKPVTEVKPT